MQLLLHSSVGMLFLLPLLLLLPNPPGTLEVASSDC
jgi:hypothetical protein